VRTAWKRRTAIYSNEADYEKLFQQLKTNTGLPNTIIQVCDFNGSSGGPGNHGIDAVFLLSKALVKQRLTRPVEVIFVNPHPSPDSAVWLSGLSGFAHSMSIENPNLLYRIIEIDHQNPTSQNAVLCDLADALAVELGAE
jgi:hypothetical protein